MSRRMSCSMTVDAVRARTKTVTRRHVDTWQTLKPGDRLTLIEKGMGLPKGAKQVVLAEVEIVDVRVEPVTLLASDIRYGRQEVALEGLTDLDPDAFVIMWLLGHQGASSLTWSKINQRYYLKPGVRTPCRRIEWRYLDGES